MKSSEQGFALVAVLLVLGLLGIIGAEFAYSMRLEASAMRSWRDTMSAAHLAEAGVEQGLRELAGEGFYASIPFDGLLTFYRQQDRAVLPRLPRTRVRLGPGEFSYRITDEQARLNVNTTPAPRLDKLLECLGVDKINRDQIVDSIQDWRDPNDEHRLNGAESEDHYLKLPVPYRAKNANIESINELRQIKGVTQALFEGDDRRPGLRDVLTARAPGSPNINTAGPVVFCAMGVEAAQISAVMQGRLEIPYLNPPGNIQGFVTRSDTFRIDAEGLIEGRPQASVTAVVRRQSPASSGGQGNVVTILEWSGVR